MVRVTQWISDKRSVNRRLAMKVNYKLLWKDMKNGWVALTVIVAYILFMLHFFGTPCPMVLMTGFPCPACGLSRAGFSIMRLEFLRAFRFNPFIYPIGGLVLLAGFYRYVLEKPCKYMKGLLIILMVSMIGFYIYRMIQYFPDVSPMVYTSNNLLHNTIMKFF